MNMQRCLGFLFIYLADKPPSLQGGDVVSQPPLVSEKSLKL